MMPGNVPRASQAVVDPRDEILTHLPSLRAYAISLTRDQDIADDMVQDTIVKAWSKIDQFRKGTNMGAWLFTILRNGYISQRRKQVREVSDPDGIFAATLASKPDHDGHLQMRDFWRALDQLPATQRETLLLLGGAGYSHEEVAAICGVAPGTIKSRANRGRRKLAALLDLDAQGAAPLTDIITQSIVTALRCA